MTQPADDVLERLAREEIAWCTTLRRDGSAHVTPVWFVHREDTWWIASAAGSVKVRNATADPRVSLALQDGAAPVVAEGRAVVHRAAFPAEITAAFAAKYRAWDITATETDGRRALLQVPVTRWLLSGMAQ